MNVDSIREEYKAWESEDLYFHVIDPNDERQQLRPAYDKLVFYAASKIETLLKELDARNEELARVTAERDASRNRIQTLEDTLRDLLKIVVDDDFVSDYSTDEEGIVARFRLMNLIEYATATLDDPETTAQADISHD